MNTDLFNEEWIKESFDDYITENEIDGLLSDEMFNDEVIDNFVTGYYWSDLFEKAFYETPNDIYLVKYIQDDEDDEASYSYFIKYLEETDNINYIREKMIYIAVSIKLKHILYMISERKF